MQQRSAQRAPCTHLLGASGEPPHRHAERELLALHDLPRVGVGAALARRRVHRLARRKLGREGRGQRRDLRAGQAEAVRQHVQRAGAVVRRLEHLLQPVGLVAHLCQERDDALGAQHVRLAQRSVQVRQVRLAVEAVVLQQRLQLRRGQRHRRRLARRGRRGVAEHQRGAGGEGHQGHQHHRRVPHRARRARRNRRTRRPSGRSASVWRRSAGSASAVRHGSGGRGEGVTLVGGLPCGVFRAHAHGAKAKRRVGARRPQHAAEPVYTRVQGTAGASSRATGPALSQVGTRGTKWGVAVEFKAVACATRGRCEAVTAVAQRRLICVELRSYFQVKNARRCKGQCSVDYCTCRVVPAVGQPSAPCVCFGTAVLGLRPP